jgi:diguanylate cyclase (GGDEF)-like protein/putative nucleotidyltransferase with HDIG domain
MSVPFAIVPAVGAVAYAGLLYFVGRRAARQRGVLAFQGMLGLLLTSATLSAFWRILDGDPRWDDVLLRVLTWSDLSIAPALLLFVASRYGGARAPVLKAHAAIVALAIAGVTATGSVNRAVLTPGDAVSAADAVAAYAIILLALATYALSAVFITRSIIRDVDPFERNRLKYVLVATLIIIAGLLTNLDPAFQQLPIDRLLAVIASTLLFFSIIRYRLFDIDVVFQRAAIAALSVLAVTPFYLAAMYQVSGQSLDAFRLWTGMVMAVPAAAVAYGVHARLKGAVDRLFLGRAPDGERATQDFTQRVATAPSQRDLAALVANACQAHFDARFTAVFLLNPRHRLLEPVSVVGSLAALHPLEKIDLDDPLLERVVGFGEPVTAMQLNHLATPFVAGGDWGPFEPLRGCLLQPIVTGESTTGLIVIGEHLYGDAYSLAQLQTLKSIAGQTGLALERVRLFEQLQTQAETDFLTGLPNHRRLKDDLVTLIRRSELESTPFTIAMVDVDNFKLLNDTHGHVAGDDGLKKIATYLRRSVRPEDIVGRYGGDEFLLILPGLEEDEAVRMLTRVAREARRIALHPEADDASASGIPMRLSWGVATYPVSAKTERTLVAAADSDLLKRRFVRRRVAQVNTNRPSIERMLQSDPRRIRLASGLLDILDTKDQYTTEHSQQVASLGLLLADELGLSEMDREYLWLGGLLHDIGKLNVPDEVVRKPGSLADSEWAAIREHPVQGAQLISGLFDDPKLTEIVGSHHERWDGTGYPRGLAGSAIPVLARAAAVCDAYSAMTHDRPYRKGLSSVQAIEELRRGAGSHWDPVMVAAFERAVSGDTHAEEGPATTAKHRVG